MPEYKGFEPNRGVCGEGGSWNAAVLELLHEAYDWSGSCVGELQTRRKRRRRSSWVTLAP